MKDDFKNWKSYQSGIRRKKRKARGIFSLARLAGALIVLLAAAYGSIWIYHAGKSYLLKKGAFFRGTGIRPITLNGNVNVDPSLSELTSLIFTGKKLQLASLSEYFKNNPPVFNEIKDGHYIQKINGYTIVYTIEPSVQREAEGILAQNNVPYGAVAAVNPETGAVLALASYSADPSDADEISPLLPYPPGSLVKIITAAAAIESKGFNPSSSICFNGGMYSTDRSFWKQGINEGANRLSLGLAFAKSCDVAFGKITGFYVGKPVLSEYFDKFYFNKKIPFVLDLKKSRAIIPDKFFQLELTGAGFKNVVATPLQEALITASVINGGRLLDPYLIEKIISSRGNVIYSHENVQVLGNPITGKTADVLRQMMIKTITMGVGHPDFYNLYNRYLLPGVIAGGKTGTITGDNPGGLYQWFAGFGEKGDKKIALSALVIEKPIWRIEGGGIAEKVLFSYFFNNKNKNSINEVAFSKKK